MLFPNPSSGEWTSGEGIAKHEDSKLKVKKKPQIFCEVFPVRTLKNRTEIDIACINCNEIVPVRSFQLHSRGCDGRRSQGKKNLSLYDYEPCGKSPYISNHDDEGDMNISRVNHELCQTMKTLKHREAGFTRESLQKAVLGRSSFSSTFKVPLKHT